MRGRSEGRQGHVRGRSEGRQGHVRGRSEGRQGHVRGRSEGSQGGHVRGQPARYRGAPEQGGGVFPALVRRPPAPCCPLTSRPLGSIPRRVPSRAPAPTTRSEGSSATSSSRSATTQRSFSSSWTRRTACAPSTARASTSPFRRSLSFTPCVHSMRGFTRTLQPVTAHINSTACDRPATPRQPTRSVRPSSSRSSSTPASCATRTCGAGTSWTR